jgi:hypothetical protein
VRFVLAFAGSLPRVVRLGLHPRRVAERLDAPPVFVDFCNQLRPHRALGGLSPSVVVNNVRGDHN